MLFYDLVRDYYSCCTILSAMNKVLYSDLGYDGNINSYRDLMGFIDLEARGFATANALMVNKLLTGIN